jgi:hypothetical protein
MNFATISMRSRTELIFQVVRESRIGRMYQGEAKKTRPILSGCEYVSDLILRFVLVSPA